MVLAFGMDPGLRRDDIAEGVAPGKSRLRHANAAPMNGF
jgi:hypothetical protein